MIAASTLTWINLPYQVLFIMLSLSLGFSFHKCHIALESYISWLLLTMLIIELSTQYALYIQSFSQTFTAREKYSREVHGLL